MSADNGLEKRLLFFMGARLALTLLSLGDCGTALEAAGWSLFTPEEWRGFYGTVIFAFVVTIGYGLSLTPRKTFQTLRSCSTLPPTSESSARSSICLADPILRSRSSMHC